MASKTPRKSLVEQIIQETIKKLEKQKEFKEENIHLLNELACCNSLTKSQSIINAIKSNSGESNEASKTAD